MPPGKFALVGIKHAAHDPTIIIFDLDGWPLHAELFFIKLPDFGQDSRLQIDMHTSPNPRGPYFFLVFSGSSSVRIHQETVRD